MSNTQGARGRSTPLRQKLIGWAVLSPLQPFAEVLTNMRCRLQSSRGICLVQMPQTLFNLAGSAKPRSSRYCPELPCTFAGSSSHISLSGDEAAAPVLCSRQTLPLHMRTTQGHSWPQTQIRSRIQMLASLKQLKGLQLQSSLRGTGGGRSGRIQMIRQCRLMRLPKASSES